MTPVDEGVGSQTSADRLVTADVLPTILAYSTDNVSSPPTEDELTAAFGNQGAGFTALVLDGGIGTVWLVVKSKFDKWWFEALTKAT